MRDAVVDATDSVLEQAEEPVDRLRVSVALDVHLRGVVDPLVRVALLAEPLVRLVLVG